MTTDSQHLPSTHVIERAIQAANEAAQEKARLRHLFAMAISLIAIGAVAGIGANIAITAAGDGHLDWIGTWKGTAHALGVSGVVLLGVYLIMMFIRGRDERRDERYSARIRRLERVCSGAEDTKTRAPKPDVADEFASYLQAIDDVGQRDDGP